MTRAARRPFAWRQRPSAWVRDTEPAPSLWHNCATLISEDAPWAACVIGTGAGQGREEFFTLFSDLIQRGAVQFFRQLGHSPSTASSRRLARAQSKVDFATLDHLGQREAVLRTLIEEFGGEVVSSTLQRRLVQLVSWKDARSDLWVRRVLGELEQCGALTLQDVDGTDVIARIQPVGVNLAYDQPAARHPARL